MSTGNEFKTEWAARTWRQGPVLVTWLEPGHRLFVYDGPPYDAESQQLAALCGPLVEPVEVLEDQFLSSDEEVCSRFVLWAPRGPAPGWQHLDA